LIKIDPRARRNRVNSPPASPSPEEEHVTPSVKLKIADKWKHVDAERDVAARRVAAVFTQTVSGSESLGGLISFPDFVPFAAM